ncbi:hypothetical protein ACQ86G_12270 [Roseateles chitinivorans]|uniref:hypothetical protein n=1 Tax=Roseateles chitinivorans TaxID=2917965 RepID=UPI003D675EC4
MTRWFRILVLTILVPAYGIAAVGVTMFAAGVAHAQHLLVDGQPDYPAVAAITAAQASADDDHAAGLSADVAALLFELGDTSDDMPDHCKPDTRALRVAPPQVSPLPTPQLHEPQRCPQPPLRPPRA